MSPALYTYMTTLNKALGSPKLDTAGPPPCFLRGPHTLGLLTVTWTAQRRCPENWVLKSPPLGSKNKAALGAKDKLEAGSHVLRGKTDMATGRSSGQVALYFH